MAAIFNHTDFWHLNAEDATKALFKHQQIDFVTFSWILGVIVCLLCPLIVFGNAFVFYAVWKDPLKNLRCSPTNFILQSMSMADLLVGLILSPMHAYLLFSSAVAQKSALSFHEIASLRNTLAGVSLAHVMLLSMDRHFAVVKPLKYKFIMTRGRINLALSFLWLCYICFGIATFLLKNSIFVVSIVFIAQMILLLQFTYCFYGSILYHLRKNHKAWQKRILQGHVRVNHHQLYAGMEGRLATAMALVIFISLFLITPMFVLICLVYFCVPCYSYPVILRVSTGWDVTLDYLNAAHSPLLYYWRLPKYREVSKYYVKNFFRCGIAAKRRHRETETFDTKL